MSELTADISTLATPGSLLKQRRIELGWPIEKIAKELLLSHAQIDAIERDDYNSLSGATYVLGYWRSYSGLLNLDIEESIELHKGQLRNPMRAITLEANHQKVQGHQEKNRKRTGLFFSILSIVFLSVIWIWQNPEDNPFTQWVENLSNTQLSKLNVQPDTSLSREEERLVVEEVVNEDVAKTTPILPEPNFSETEVQSQISLESDSVEQVESVSTPTSNEGGELSVENSDTNVVNSPAMDPQLLPSDGLRVDDGQNVESSGAVTIVGQAIRSAGGGAAVDDLELNNIESVIEESLSLGQEADTVAPENEGETTSNSENLAETQKVAEPGSEVNNLATTAIGDDAIPNNEVQVDGQIGGLVDVNEPVDSQSRGTQIVTGSEVTPGSGAEELVLVESLNLGGDEVDFDPLSPHYLELLVEKETWIDVRDVTGEKLVYRTVEDAQRLQLKGEPPFYVFIGTSSGVSVNYLGEPVAFKMHSSGLFARFKVGELQE